MNKITILQHNVRSWQQNKISLCNIYNSVDPDVILLNEHSVINAETLKIFNYNVHSVNKLNERHAGAAIAIKKGIPYRLQDDFESDMIGITLTIDNSPVTIVTTYVPPRINYLNLIDFNKVLKLPHPSYILGDLNARHWTLGNTNCNPKGHNLNKFIISRKCSIIGPYFPTYIGYNATTAPDLVIGNKKTFHNIKLTPGPKTPSDHIPIVAILQCSPILIPIRPRRQFTKANWELYKGTLENKPDNLPERPSLEEIDNALHEWEKDINQASELAIPEIKYRPLPGLKPSTTTVRLEHTIQYILDRIVRLGPSPELYHRLNNVRNRLNTEYRRLSNLNWDNLLSKINLEKDPKIFWSSIKKLSGNTNKQTAPHLRVNGLILKTPEEKLPILKTYWSNLYDGTDDPDYIADVERETAVRDELATHSHLLTPHTHGDMNRLDPTTCPPITNEELSCILKKLKQKAPGPLGITANQLKKLPNSMKLRFLRIINNCLSAGYFPNHLKMARIILLPKNNTAQASPSEFRPISLLDTHGKIFDTILNSRLQNHLLVNNQMNPRQHGFRPNRGTHTALAVIHETVVRHKAMKHPVDVVLRDVSKAFDKVWHSGLKLKIIRLGLHPALSQTIINFLHGRRAFISISKTDSQSFPLNSGVPQGACISPSLFSVYTADIPEPAPHSEFVAYADDITQIISQPRNYVHQAHATSLAIQTINNFESQWKIKTNQQKFQIIPISRRKTSQVTVDDSDYAYSHKGKVLGLSFTGYGLSTQVPLRCKIAKMNLTKLYRFHGLSPYIKRKLYIATVRSALAYPAIPLNTLSKTAMLKLQRVQNAGVRFITQTSLRERVSSQTLHERARLPPINMYLHDAASTLWEKIQVLEPEIYENARIPNDLVQRQHAHFRSSLLLALSDPPTPIFA